MAIAPTNPAAKSSVTRKNSRYVLGGLTEISPGFLQWWNKNFLTNDSTDIYYTLEKKFEQRPDLLANAFYDDPYLWWVIPQYNTVLDFNTEFLEGLVLRVPTKTRVNAFATNSNIGGIPPQTL